MVLVVGPLLTSQRLRRFARFFQCKRGLLADGEQTPLALKKGNPCGRQSPLALEREMLREAGIPLAPERETSVDGVRRIPG